MNKVSVGIVGAGVIAKNMHLPILLSMQNVNVAWLTDADSVRGKQVADAYRVPYVELPASPRDLPECDVVLLAIPLVPRRLYYEQLAARGTAVMAEKPFAINNQDHKIFQRLFESHKIACVYQRRTYATNRLLRKIVEEEWFGRLHGISIFEGGRTTKTGVDQSYQDLSIKDGGGILINLGCHVIDLAFFITGAKGYSLSKSDIVFDGDTDRKACGEIILLDLNTRSGRQCPFKFCVSWLDYQPNTIELEFENVNIVCPISPNGKIDVRMNGKSHSMAKLEPKENDGASTINQAFFIEWDEFLRGFRECRPSMLSPEESEITSELIDDLLGMHRKVGK